jgi:hypothetical protein
MQRRPVTSSNVNSLGWEDGTLDVAFHSGHIYQYAGVPEGVYQAALGANSVGRYIAMHVVDKYESKRLK